MYCFYALGALKKPGTGWLNIRWNDFITCWAYVETISSHTESTPDELMRMLSQRSNLDKFLHGHPNACWANTKTISSLAEHTWKRFNRLLSISRIEFIAWWANGEIFLKKEGWTAWWSILLIYGGGDLSMEEETRLWRGRFLYGGGDSSTEGKTHFFWDGGKKPLKVVDLLYIFSPVKSCLFMWYFGIKMLQVVRWWST